MNLHGYDWGIAEFSAKGNLVGGTTTSNSWELALGGESNLVTPGDRYWLALMSGEEGTNGRLKGAFDGIWLSKTNDNPDDGSVSGGSIRIGDAIGDYDTNASTWEMMGTAEWGSEATATQFTQTGLGFTISDLGKFVNSPVWEAYSAPLTLAEGSNQAFTSASTTVHLFDNDVISGPGSINVWTAVIDGVFSGSGPADPHNWALKLSDGSSTLTLTGDKWDVGGWHAKASGTLPGGNSVNSGEAGGMISTSSNDFEGMAAGTYIPIP
jgi:hypothetical protein